MDQEIERTHAASRETLKPTAEQRFRALTENSWEVVACLSSKGIIRFTTRSCSKVIEYTPEEVIGREAFTFVHTDDRVQVTKLFADLLLHKKIETARFRLITKSGDAKWVQCTAKNLLKNPAVGSVVIYYHDITEQKRVEEALLASEEQFRTLADALPQLAWMANPEGELFWYNQRWFDFTGTTFEEMQERGWEHICYPAHFPRVLKSFKEALKKGEPWEETFKMKSKESGWRWFLTRAVPVKDRDGNIMKWIGTNTDVTEQVEIEDQLGKTQRELLKAKLVAESANEAKSQFLANMSHEIRTPLGAILGFTDLIRDPNVDEETRLEYANIAHRNGQKLYAVLNDILDLSKVEAGKLQIDQIVFSLRRLVDETAKFLEPLTSKKSIKLSVAPYPNNFPEQICSDPGRIRQILVNVIGNAIKFTPPNGNIELSVSLDSQSKYAFIDVKDSGVGMTEEQQDHVFRAFVQGDGTKTRTHGGTGLGLTISKNLSRLLGGDLYLLKSAPGQGSTFRCSLEMIPPSKCDDGRLREDRGNGLRKPIRGAKILLAEDSPDNQLLVKQYLKPHDVALEIVENGEEAFTRAMSGEFDLVLMDIQMPVMDGYQATRKLRDAGYNGIIIALTAHALTEERTHSFEAGCDEHLTKPIDRTLLIETLRKYLE